MIEEENKLIFNKSLSFAKHHGILGNYLRAMMLKYSHLVNYDPKLENHEDVEHLLKVIDTKIISTQYLLKPFDSFITWSLTERYGEQKLWNCANDVFSHSNDNNFYIDRFINELKKIEKIDYDLHALIKPVKKIKPWK